MLFIHFVVYNFNYSGSDMKFVSCCPAILTNISPPEVRFLVLLYRCVYLWSFVLSVLLKGWLDNIDRSRNKTQEYLGPRALPAVLGTFTNSLSMISKP
jgi:hypothetical protein